MQGTVTSFVQEKQFGFIKGDDGKDYFFHRSSFQSPNVIDSCLDGALVEFAPTATAKGYRAERCSLVDTSELETCELPEVVLFSKTGHISGWELIEVSDWIVNVSSSVSPDAARLELTKAALQFSASAVLEVEYYKTTGSQPGTGKGTYFFTVHNFRGRLALVAKRRVEGSYHLAEFRGINQRADNEKKRLMELSRKSRKRATIVWPLAFLVSFLGWWVLLGTSFNWFAAIHATITAGLVGAFYGVPGTYDSWLQFSQVER